MTIAPTTRAEAAATPGATEPKALGQDAFMKLLITQLQHQDPTKPQDDTQFIAQLAQFSSLERLTSIQQSIASMNTALQALVEAAGNATTSGASTAAPAPASTVPAQ